MEIEKATQDNVCPGCDGRRIQKGNDGINIVCPVCNGEGTWMPIRYLPIWIYPYVYLPTIQPSPPFYVISGTGTGTTIVDKVTL